MNDRLIPSAADARTSPGASASACGTSQPHESARAQVQGLAPYVDDLPALPQRRTEEDEAAAAFLADVVSYQHPDHDTPAWPPR